MQTRCDLATRGGTETEVRHTYRNISDIFAMWDTDVAGRQAWEGKRTRRKGTKKKKNRCK